MKKPAYESQNEAFDISEMEIVVKMVTKRKAVIEMTDASPINAMKYYLRLAAYVEDLGRALGIHDSEEGLH